VQVKTIFIAATLTTEKELAEFASTETRPYHPII